MELEIIDTPTDEMREAVNAPLRLYNQTANPIFWQARERPENDSQPLNVFAFDDDRQVIGGLFGSTQFSWLKIDIMAVAECRRHEGIGRALLSRAEAAGLARGCKYAFTDTMDFQAPDFYRLAGYRVAGAIDDWDSHGHTKYFLTKDL
ncbi:MAG: GNAT family N-acetyltransferase [Verrucomicrobiales bacterium]